MFVSLALSAAQAQTFELTAEDMGTTVPLVDADLAYAVDVTAPDLDLEQVNLLTADGETSLAELYDNVLADGADIDDLMVLSLGDREELRVTFLQEEGGGGRTCVPLLELRCTWVWGARRCQWV